MKILFWLKSHMFRICFWVLIITSFASGYNGDSWESRMVHAVLNTFGVFVVMMVGQLSWVEKEIEKDQKYLKEINERIKTNDTL